MIKIKKTSIIGLSILVMLFVVSVIVSMDKFSTSNPFAVINGLFQITFSSKEYVEIQKSPKVIIAKADGASYEELIQFMGSRGYTLLEDRQEGAMSTFENNQTKDIEYVIFSANKYYSLWVWKI